MNNVLLISFANWDSLMELPGVLKAGGFTVDIYCVKDSWALQNNSWTNWISASTDPDIFVKELLTLIDQKWDHYNWIIPGDDLIIRLLNDRLVSEREFYKIMPLTKIENRELLGSKAGFSGLCAKYGIKTPGFLIYDASLTPRSIVERVGLPMLIKLDQSEAGTGVFRIENETELTQKLAAIKDKDKLVFQQFIQGYDINIEALYKDGELLVFSYSKVLTILGNFGLSTQRLFCRNAEVGEELKKIGKSFGLNGFASIAFMFSEREKSHYLIEVDVRPNSWIYYGKFLGNDFSKGIAKMIKGDLTLVQPGEKDPKEMKIYHYLKDGARAIVKKDIRGILRWVTNQDGCWRFIPLYDRKSFAACNRYLSFFFKDLFKNKMRKTFGIKHS